MQDGIAQMAERVVSHEAAGSSPAAVPTNITDLNSVHIITLDQ